MSSQKDIQDELKSLESSLPFSNSQPFSVPDGYFEGFAAVVLAKVKGSEMSPDAEMRELSPLLAGIPKITPYSVPLSYFEENLAGAVNKDGVDVEEGWSRTTPYAVPDGYFEAFPSVLLNKILLPKAKVVPLFARNWMRVASAAIVGGALFFGGYQLFSKNPEPSEPVAQQPDTTKNLVASNNQPVLKEIKQASTKELEEFIETVQVTAALTPKQNKLSDKNEVEELLKDVPTSEMEVFLSAIPTADDDLLITD